MRAKKTDTEPGICRKSHPQELCQPSSPTPPPRPAKPFRRCRTRASFREKDRGLLVPDRLACRCVGASLAKSTAASADAHQPRRPAPATAETCAARTCYHWELPIGNTYGLGARKLCSLLQAMIPESPFPFQAPRARKSIFFPPAIMPCHRKSYNRYAGAGISGRSDFHHPDPATPAPSLTNHPTTPTNRSPTPKALHPPAQGRRTAATLGKTNQTNNPTLKGLCLTLDRESLLGPPLRGNPFPWPRPREGARGTGRDSCRRWDREGILGPARTIQPCKGCAFRRRRTLNPVAAKHRTPPLRPHRLRRSPTETPTSSDTPRRRG